VLSRFAVFMVACNFVIFTAYSQNVAPPDRLAAEQLRDQSFYLGNPVTHPEELSGLWEAPDDRGGVIGLHLTLRTTAPSSVTKLTGVRQSWGSLEADIYQRTRGEFHPGNSTGFTDSVRGGSLRYDNGRLILHTTGFDLDLLHIAGDRWSGRVHRTEFDSDVTLTRPGYKTTAKQAWFVGTWRSTEELPMQRCLHIVQNAPGEFIAWSDSLQTLGKVFLAPGVKKPPHALEDYGDLADVHTWANGNLEIELHAYGGLCCSHSFIATPAEHATIMRAEWPSAANQAAHKTEWKRMSGNSCISSRVAQRE
jgi:hypothetical protein